MRLSCRKPLAVLLAAHLAACATYTPTPVTIDAAMLASTRAEQGGLALSAEEYASEQKAKRAFDTKMAKEGVLPLLVQVENASGQPWPLATTDFSVDDGTSALRMLNSEEAARKAGRSAAGRAIGWSLIVPIISIPFVAVGSAVHTGKVNKAMAADFGARSVAQQPIEPGAKSVGFLFFELPRKRKDLTGLHLRLITKHPGSGEAVTLSVPLASGKLR